MDLFQIQIHIFWILNPINLIGYELDINWIHFWIIQIALWDGF